VAWKRRRCRTRSECIGDERDRDFELTPSLVEQKGIPAARRQRDGRRIAQAGGEGLPARRLRDSNDNTKPLAHRRTGGAEPNFASCAAIAAGASRGIP